MLNFLDSAGMFQKQHLIIHAFIEKIFKQTTIAYTFKGIVKWQGREGTCVSEWNQQNRYDFANNRRCFLGTLN